MNTSQVRTLPLVLGALVGIGIVFMIDPHHGEKRRNQLKSGCKDLGARCKQSWAASILNWGRRAARSVSDFETEIRANAPAYLQ